jgi:hypothetical protein
VKGPQITGVIEHMSGADWGLVMGGTGVIKSQDMDSYLSLTSLYRS